MKGNSKLNDYLIGVVLIVLIIAGIIVFLMQANKPGGLIDQEINSYPIIGAPKQTKIDDSKEFVAGDLKITLPTGFTLTQIYSETPTYYRCGSSTNTDCTIYVIYKEDTAEYFYFSTNAEYVYESTYPIDKIEKKVVTALGEKTLILNNAQISGSDDGNVVEEATLTIQAYTLLSNKVYASTGYILYDTANNQQKVENFISFLANLKIENI